MHYLKFPDGPVVSTWHFHCQGLGSIPSRGTKILQAVIWGLKKKNYPLDPTTLLVEIYSVETMAYMQEGVCVCIHMDVNIWMLQYSL